MISIGFDVGRNHDPAALVVLHHTGTRGQSHRPSWTVLEAGNVELGTDYSDLAATVVDLGTDFHTAGYATVVTVDATGIGGAVVELARKTAPAGLPVVAVTIGTGRALARHSDRDFVVGKHRLTETLQVALEQGGLTLPDSDGSRALHRQLAAFSRRPTRSGYQKHEAATGHDDLVLALELGLWTGDAMHDQHAGVTT